MLKLGADTTTLAWLRSANFCSSFGRLSPSPLKISGRFFTRQLSRVKISVYLAALITGEGDVRGL
jgi:hypothetical protein